MRITTKAHAKINWSLNILGVLENGYHELDMLMQSIALHNELTFEPADELSLNVDGQPLPEGGGSLIIRAANALNDCAGRNNGARIHLVQHIPQRAGLGGGSADCAAALTTLNRMWKLNLPMEALLEIGLKLGADVPFCLTGGLARVGGIGEKLSPIENAPEIPLAMVTPGGGLSTPEVFRKWDGGGWPVSAMDPAALADALTKGNLDRAQALSFNALEAPAIAMLPEIGAAIDAFRGLGARFVRMTGSGSTVFAAFDTDAQAQRAAAQVPGAIATRTISHF